ncbi:hypothetical protein LAV79_15325 [Peribacillus butanolivorans]|uniref:hypothetical protein n=1 Tax=Peribacillus butanolivorans TaxID=421767 RepID=UPI0030C9BFC6
MNFNVTKHPFCYIIFSVYITNIHAFFFLNMLKRTSTGCVKDWIPFGHPKGTHPLSYTGVADAEIEIAVVSIGCCACY